MVVVTNEPFTDPNDDVENERNSKKDANAETHRFLTGDRQQALDLLQTQLKTSNFHLVKECVQILDETLDRTNVLKTLSLTRTPLNNNNFQPSAPPENCHQIQEEPVKKIFQDLRHNCLLIIDQNPEFILRHDDLLDLDYSDLAEVLTRDTFDVKNELLIYVTVIKWGVKECQRRHLSQEYKYEIIRDLKFAPRYGLLSKKEFNSKYTLGEKGPTRNTVLDEKIWRKILFYIKEKSKGHDVEELPYNMSKSRKGTNGKPKNLSMRSASKALESQSLARKPSQASGTKCDRFFVNFLVCWATVFD